MNRQMQRMLNQMLKSPQVQNNPMAKNVVQMYQNGNMQGLQNMAENMAKEKGITVDDVKNNIMQSFNRN